MKCFFRLRIEMANRYLSHQDLGTVSPNHGLQEHSRTGNPPASSYLNAFERSFESFLNNKVEQPATNPSSASKDQGSAAEISAILADNSLGAQRIQNPLLTYQTKSYNIKKNNQEAFIGYRKVQGPKPKLLSKTMTLSRTFDSNQIIVEEKMKRTKEPALVSYQDDESTEAVNNLLKAEAGEFSPERRFACSTCPKTFKSRGHLKEHEMIHTGEFPFHCENCSKGFRREAALLTHKCPGTVTSRETNTNTSELRGQKVYKCDLCERTYASKQYFQVHKCSKGNESVTRQSKLLAIEESFKSVRNKVKKDVDAENYLENVHIEVPVRVVSSEIVFTGDNHCAYIEGDIIDLDVEDITLEEAISEGYQVETLNENSNTLTIEGIIRKQVSNNALPCAFEMMSLSSGISIDEIGKVMEMYSDDNSVETCTFPWQTVDSKENEISKGWQDNKLLLEENECAGKQLNTLEELPSIIRSKSSDKPQISLNKFTYFNDTSIAYGSGDDSDDEDWSELSEKAKRKPPLKSQSKRPGRNQSSLGLSEKRRSMGQKTVAKITSTSNSSLLLQDEDDEDDFKTNDG